MVKSQVTPIGYWMLFASSTFERCVSVTASSHTSSIGNMSDAVTNNDEKVITKKTEYDFS